MPLQVLPFTERQVIAARAFNQRMLAGNAPTDFLLPTEANTKPVETESPIHWNRYVVLDGEEVRGGVLEMDQPGWLNGRQLRTSNFQSPLSEGIVNPKYSMVGMQIVKFMQKRSEATFMVGMGSAERPLPKLLAASGWSIRTVPFLFRVHNSGKFLREIQVLRTTRTKRLVASAAWITGLGALGLGVMQARRHPPNGKLRQVASWGDWTDEIWQRYLPYCSFAVLRDRRTLEGLYPTDDPRLRIMLIERDRNPVGWAVCINAKLANHRYFGNLQLASILDCVADPDAMALTAILTDREMASQGADLVLVNHCHFKWMQAFRSVGFLSGPSNYLLAMSKRMTEFIGAEHHGFEQIHVTRGDGDGRIHLT